MRTVDLAVTAVYAPRPDLLIPAIEAVCAQVAVVADRTVATRTTNHTGEREGRRRVR